MNYTFKIDNYNRADDLLGVVYIPNDERLSGSFIRVRPGATEEETLANIKMMAPVEVWELELSLLESSKCHESLIGMYGEGTQEETVSNRKIKDLEIGIRELAMRVKVGVNMASQFYLEEIVTGHYPEYERQSWVDQEREARAFLLDPYASYPLLEGIARARNLTTRELVGRVIAKADAFRVLVASVIGARQALHDRIDLIAAKHTSGLLSEDEAREQLSAVVWIGLEGQQSA